jgi:hypothetical protein
MDFKAKMATGAVGGTGLVAATNILAEMLDGYFQRHGLQYDINTVELLVASALGFIAGGPILVLSEIARQATLKGMLKLGIDLTKVLGNGVAALLLCFAVGCAGAQTPAQRYFVAKSHYASVGDLVTSWCAQPSTPVTDCEAADEVMDRAEAEIASLEQLSGPSPGRYELAAAVLVKALEIINRFKPEAP